MQIFIATFLVCLINSSKAQQLNLAEHPKTIKGDFTYCMPDQLGNVYALSRSGQLTKYNPNLDSM